jgi:HAD superfamily hydrolase (TIGR01662 family)
VIDMTDSKDAARLKKYEKTYGKEGAKVRNRLFKNILAKADWGTKAGQWSARKAQALTEQYEEAMKGKGKSPYKSSQRTKSQKSLKRWGDKKWRTKSGQDSSKTGERYLPEKAIKALTDEEYKKTSAKKRQDTKKGKQFSDQPKDIAKKVKKYRGETFEADSQCRECYGTGGLYDLRLGIDDECSACEGTGIVSMSAENWEELLFETRKEKAIHLKNHYEKTEPEYEYKIETHPHYDAYSVLRRLKKKAKQYGAEKWSGQCHRCDKKTNSHTMSWFNTELICMDCSNKEKSHPKYQEAKDKELEQVKRGNYNYEGIGFDAEVFEAKSKRNTKSRRIKTMIESSPNMRIDSIYHPDNPTVGHLKQKCSSSNCDEMIMTHHSNVGKRCFKCYYENWEDLYHMGVVDTPPPIDMENENRYKRKTPAQQQEQERRSKALMDDMRKRDKERLERWEKKLRQRREDWEKANPTEREKMIRDDWKRMFRRAEGYTPEMEKARQMKNRYIPPHYKVERKDGRKYLFLDFDNTVRHTIPDPKPDEPKRRRPPHKAEEVVLIDGVKERVHEWADAGYFVVGLTNQSNIESGYNTTQDVVDAIKRTLDLLDMQFPVYFASHKNKSLPDYNFRKPMTGMIDAAFGDFGSPNRTYSVMIGDDWEGADSGMARNANINFIGVLPFIRMSLSDAEHKMYLLQKNGERLEMLNPDNLIPTFAKEYDEKLKRFDSESSYSKSAFNGTGVKMAYKMNMKTILALAGGLYLGYIAPSLYSRYMGGSEESNADTVESTSSLANQGFMENWTGGNEGDDNLSSTGNQPAPASPKYDYDPLAMGDAVAHDPSTRPPSMI